LPPTGAWALVKLAHLVSQEGAHEPAARLYAQSLARFRELAEPQGTAGALYGLAHVACGRGDFERAARVLGAADALAAAAGAPDGAFLGRRERRKREHSVAAARAALGEQAFVDACAEGHALPPEQAIRVALAPGRPAAPRPLADGRSPARALAAGHRRPPRAAAPPDGLTARETEVLRLVAAGRSNREIAGDLVLSVRTVEKHIASIYAKLGARGRAEAVIYALRGDPLAPQASPG